MEEYTYKGNLIHKDKEGKFYVYLMNFDGDIDEYPANSKEEAMQIVDKHEITHAGQYMDLDETTEAYELGGVSKHWTEYTIENEDDDDEETFDEEAYYNDFNSWWDNLPFEEQKRIYEQITQ